MFFKYPISEAVQEWIYDNFFWAIRVRLLTPKTPLVLATKEFFTAPKGEGDEVVEALVTDIQRILGKTDKRILVKPLNVVDRELHAGYSELSAAAGTWQDDGTQAVISYDPHLLKNPISLVSTLAHEVMHDVLHSIPEYPPGGEEAEELNTDLHCITTGFGVLHITQAQDLGWAGYMRQGSRIHALALFTLVKEIPENEVLDVLPDGTHRQFKKAMRYLEKDMEKIVFLREKLHAKRPKLK